jgi:hypothetical protein
LQPDQLAGIDDVLSALSTLGAQVVQSRPSNFPAAPQDPTDLSPGLNRSNSANLGTGGAASPPSGTGVFIGSGGYIGSGSYTAPGSYTGSGSYRR